MSANFLYPQNFIKYLGTGGARFCMMSQMRWTGGIWFSYGGLNGVIDPGPGSLHHICCASPELAPRNVRAIILTHRHLDHSTDINVMAEAMTEGGFKKQGKIILPQDAFSSPDPVLLKYCAHKVEEVICAIDKSQIDLGMGVTAEPVSHTHHGVECYGMIFRKEGLSTWGVISDTKPLASFAERYADCVYISINATFPDKKPRLEHMSIADVGELLERLHPKLATISHMGVVLIENGPEKYAKQISTEQTKVLAGKDGMVIDLDTLKVYSPISRERTADEYQTIE